MLKIVLKIEFKLRKKKFYVGNPVIALPSLNSNITS